MSYTIPEVQFDGFKRDVLWAHLRSAAKEQRMLIHNGTTCWPPFRNCMAACLLLLSDRGQVPDIVRMCMLLNWNLAIVSRDLLCCRLSTASSLVALAPCEKRVVYADHNQQMARTCTLVRSHCLGTSSVLNIQPNLRFQTQTTEQHESCYEVLIRTEQ